jgi:hypothetical protein
MRAIILSIHSQVPGALTKLGHRFETIISLDSHLDVSLGGDSGLYPKELRIIAARTGAHAAIQNMTGGMEGLKSRRLGGHLRPRLIVAIPQRMLAKHASDLESRLPASLRIQDRKKSIASVVDYLAGTLGVEVYQSPPKPLSNLARLVRGIRSWVLDIDVDYMYEMQEECYTQIRGAGPDALQSMSRVVRFVRESRPETIIISEARVSAIRDSKSNFSKLIAGLSDLGYEIVEGGVFESDAEVLRGIAVCREFYRTISRGLMVRHMPGMMRGDLRGFEKEEEAKARKFFRSKGYAV